MLVVHKQLDAVPPYGAKRVRPTGKAGGARECAATLQQDGTGVAYCMHSGGWVQLSVFIPIRHYIMCITSHTITAVQ